MSFKNDQINIPSYLALLPYHGKISSNGVNTSRSFKFKENSNYFENLYCTLFYQMGQRGNKPEVTSNNEILLKWHGNL